MKLKKIYVKAVALVVLTIATYLLFINSANLLLLPETQTYKTDAVIILMGSVSDRILQAADIFQAGLAKEIIIVKEKQTGIVNLNKRGVDIPSQAQRSQSALIQLGIPDSLITIIPGQAASTRDEADTISSYLTINKYIQSITIVSSPTHLRRAKLIFRNTFDNKNLQVHIQTIPSSYTPINTKHWWRDRETAKAIVMEYMKLIYFNLYERWK